MTHPKDQRSIEERERYVDFANYCLQLAKVATDRDARVLREMAAEWLKLAERPVDDDH
jgi:hypothetical protein